MRNRFIDRGDLPATLSVSEVASYLGVSVGTANSLMKSENFPSYRVNSRILVSKEDFLGWIDSQKNKRKGD